MKLHVTYAQSALRSRHPLCDPAKTWRANADFPAVPAVRNALSLDVERPRNKTEGRAGLGPALESDTVLVNSAIHTKRYTQANVGPGPALYPISQDYNFSCSEGYFVHKEVEPRKNGMKIVFLSSSGHTGTYAEGERPVISLPQTGRVEVELDGQMLKINSGDMSLIGPCQRRSRMIADPAAGTYDSYLIFLPKSWTGRLPAMKYFSSPDPQRAHLSELLKFSIASLSRSDRVSERTALLFEALIEDAVSLILPEEETATRSARLASVARDAMAYIDTHFAEPLSVATVAAAVGVDVRTLQKAMKSQAGRTFRGQLGLTRLTAMRRSLESGTPGNSVTSAAMGAGLFHLGRASKAYHGHFCEAPSQTLRRAKSDGSGRN